MRKASLVLAIAACAASSLSLAQRRDPASELAPPAATASAETATDDLRATRGKSGFGQVMSVLTGLLQEAADKEASDASPSTARATTARTLSPDQSAVTITVTPAAGRSTFFVDKVGRGNATSPSRIAATAIEANAAQAGQVTMQAEGVPD